MSNNYVVRPMGADPRTSVTITDSEIIYKNGLIGSSVKRVPLQDARVEYSSLVKGGELVVKDHGQEVFRVGGIVKPAAFYEEFDRRKNQEKNPSVKDAPQQAKNEVESSEVVAKSLPIVFDKYYFEDQEFDDRDQAIMGFFHRMDEIAKFTKYKPNPWSEYFNNLLVATFIPSSAIEERNSHVSLLATDIENIGGRNKDILGSLAKENGYRLEFPVREYVLKMDAGTAFSFAYIPEAELFAVSYNHIDKKTGSFSCRDTLVTDSFDYSLNGMYRDVEMRRKFINGAGITAGAVGLVTAAFFAASAAFGEELPTHDNHFEDLGEYSLQIEP